MTLTVGCPPDPVGQQGPPARVAASDPWRSLRDTRGPLPIDYGDGLPWRQAHRKNLGVRLGKLDTHTPVA
jgi:hypothetical protein